MRHRMAIAVMALLGLLLSVYLTLYKLGIAGPLMCGPGDSCERVQLGPYGDLFGIPVALLGGLTYITFIGLGFAIAREWVEDYTRLALFFIAVIGFVFSLYLTYIEVAVLHEICPWCVFSAIIVTP